MSSGTILNYFGLANTYNPFTDENALQEVHDLDFDIPLLSPFKNADYVAVSTGLLTTSLSFLNDSILQVIDPNTNKKIADLNPIIGDIGNDKYTPKENEVFWFNKEGLRGTYFLNSIYAGKKLRIVSGRYITTSITSAVLNDMFERTIGVPSYIEDINNKIEAIKNNSTFVLKEVITKTGEGNQNWALNWREDLEYLQVCGIVEGDTNALISMSSFGLFSDISDSTPLIGYFGSYAGYQYFGGEFQKNIIGNFSALPNLMSFPILEDKKPVLALKNNGSNSIKATLYFLVRSK